MDRLRAAGLDPPAVQHLLQKLEAAREAEAKGNFATGEGQQCASPGDILSASLCGSGMAGWVGWVGSRCVMV